MEKYEMGRPFFDWGRSNLYCFRTLKYAVVIDRPL